MESIFNSETSSLFPETENISLDILGIGDIYKSNYGWEKGGDRSSSSDYPGEEYLPKVESYDLPNGGDFDINKMVNEALPKVGEMLQRFAEKPEFEVGMKLAFGNSYDVEKADIFKAAFFGGDLGVLPEIKIVDGDLINGANGAFAGETETIYLARDFVWENLGNVGAIAHVIVEEFGHYIDGEINTFDTPGDEGEIFVDLVRGVELSVDELLRMKAEDDWAIGFLDGERISIEQKTQSDELNFSGNDVRLGQNLPFDGEFRYEDIQFDINESGNPNNAVFGFDWNVNASVGIVPFLNAFELGSASFEYPINVDVELPDRVLPGNSFEIDVTDLQLGELDLEGSGLEIGNFGIDLEYQLGAINVRDFYINNPLKGEEIFRGDLINYSGGPRDTVTLIEQKPGDFSPSLNFPIIENFIDVSLQLPQIGDFEVERDTTSTSSLPSLNGTAQTQDSILKVSGDIDAVLVEFTPPLKSFLSGLSVAGVESTGLGFNREFSDSETRGKVEASFDLADIKVNVGAGLEQELIFEPKDLRVTMSIDGLEQSSSLQDLSGQSLQFTAPSDGAGTLEIKAEYELLGEIQTKLSPTFDYSVDLSLIQGGITGKLGPAQIGRSFGPLAGPFTFPEDGSVPLPGAIISSQPQDNPFINVSPIEIEQLGDNVRTVVEVTYSIPYSNIDISNASAEEGETLEFTVTLAEPSEEPISINYSSDKGSGTVNFAPGETTQTIEIPTTDDEVDEPTETFEISLNNPRGISFPEGESTITATGTIFDNDDDDDDDDDEPPEPIPPQTDSHNDPRLITFDGLYYDFQAVGEFTFIKSNSGDLNIQVRQQPINETNESVSINTAVATVLNGQRVGLYVDQEQPLLIDGIPTEIADRDSIILGDGRIYRNGNIYTIQYPGGQQLIATFRGQRIDIQTYLGPGLEGQISGIVGNNNGDPSDDIALPNGTVLQQPISEQQLYTDFANSWRLTPETSLFDYQPGEDTTTFTNFNFPVGNITLDDLDPVARQEAEQLADEFGLTDPTLREAAIIDYVLTNDIGIFEAALEAQIPEARLIIDIEPEAIPDTAITSSNTPITIDVLANDISTEGIPLSLETFSQTSAGGGIVTRNDNGTPEDTTDDQLIYTPPINYSGTDNFQYTINDRDQTTSALVTINIPNLNLATLESNSGFVVNSTTPGNFTGIAVNKIGDINGDNIDDIATGAFAADPEGNNSAGETYVIFGNNQPFPENIDPNTLNGSNGFTLEGFVQTGFSGGAVSSAGDVNKDGINDMIIGAFGVTTNGQNNVGQAYVIFGSRDLFPPTIDIASLDGTNGFALTGLSEFDYAGSAVGSAGDFNRDGIDDVFVSAPGPLNGQAGKTYVLFGNSSGFPPSQNLAQLNGTNGVIIDGLYTKSGGSVSSAGDVNQDGYDDLIIGADIGGTDSYVVYGGESLPATTYLSNLTNGFKIFGVDVVTDNGTNVSGVGDVNNDGIDDVIVSVTGTTADGVSGVSKGYVIFGEAGGLPSDVDVKTLNGTNGFVITSANIDGISGMAVSGQGDFNQDGIADIILGKPNDNGNTGNSYVIFGSQESFPTNIDLASLNGTNGIAILGTEVDDLTGVSVASAGDVNQDTVDDVIIGAPGNLFNDSPGKSYVVFGDGNFGNSVSLVFDEGYYLANNPEVNSAISSGLVRNGLEHFSQYGVDEERDFRVFLFNEKYYLEQNPDVADLVAQGAYSNGLEHFTQLGQFEGRKPSPATTTTAEINFDEQYYLTQNPDVKSLVEQGILSSGFEHYIEVGQFQGRLTAA